MSESLLIRAEGRLRRLTLNRPDRRNAIDVAACRTLLAAIEEAAADPAVGVILLDGNGEDFCAGMDLGEALETDPDVAVPLHLELFSIGNRLRKPMLAAVQGAALGGGLGLALNAHVVLAASDAKFGLPESRIGLWPYVVFRAVAAATGERKATELALTARLLDAEEALSVGIADLIVDPEASHEKARRIATEMTEGSNVAGDGLAFLQRIRGLGAAEAIEVAEEFRRKAYQSPDFQEGVAAFREKRKPVWPPRQT